MEDDAKIHERILLLKHCFYFDSLGDDSSLTFLNKTLEEKGIKKVNTFQEAAYILTDSQLSTVLNGISVVFPFRGQYYLFKNNHLYINQDSSDKILADLDRVLRIYKETAFVILNILIRKQSSNILEIKDLISNTINANIDLNHVLGEFQNNYQIITSQIVNNDLVWKIPDEFKDLINSQLTKIKDYDSILEKIPDYSKSVPSEMKTKRKTEREGETFKDLNQVLDLLRKDTSTIQAEPKKEIKKEKEVKKKIEKTDVEGKSITVEGQIKKILKNDITFRTLDGQEVRFTCSKPELIAYCIGNINKTLRFYFDVKASDLVCQKVEVAD